MGHLTKIFSPFQNHSVAYSSLWYQAGEGLFYGHIYRKALLDNKETPCKWTQYGYTVMMSISALRSMESNSLFKRHAEKVELFRYTVLIAQTLNFLRVFFNTSPYHTPDANRAKELPQKCSILLWNYTPSVLSIVNIAMTVLEAKDRPLKALCSAIGFALSYRDSGKRR